MSDQRDKNFVRHSVDTGLSSLEGNPFLAQRIMNRERTEKPIMKRKISIAAILTIILMLACAATAIGAATNEAFNAWLYKRWPEAALRLMPVNLVSEDKGFRLEVNSFSAEGDEVLISYTVEDLEGNRLQNSSIFPQVFLGDNEIETRTGAEEYDAQACRLYSAEYVKYTGQIAKPENGVLSLSWQLFNHFENHDRDLFAYLKEHGEKLGTTNALPSDLKVTQPGLSPDETSFADSGLPDTLRIIDSSESLEIALLDDLFLSGVKMIDGQLHIQFHCHNPHMEHNNGVMYRPCEVRTDLQDENGDDLPYVTEETHDEMRVLSWGLTGSYDVPEWEEIILPVDAAKLEKAGTLPILIRKNLEYVNANFTVNLPLRLIGNR